jgi:hypothetical protein
VTHVAHAPERHAGHVVGRGQCVDFVREVTGLPPTGHWREGAPAFEAVSGGAIASFDANGRYGSHTNGASHAAILIWVEDDGLRVWDQWVGHPVAQRVIRFKGGNGMACDDGDAFSLIEVA